MKHQAQADLVTDSPKHALICIFFFSPFISLILILSSAPMFLSEHFFYLSSIILLHCEFLTHILFIFVILCSANNAFIHSALPRYLGPGIQILTRRLFPLTHSIFWSKESDREHS